MRKVESGLRKLDEAAKAALYIRVSNLGAMEINVVRPFFTQALDRFHYHSRREAAAAGTIDSMARADDGAGQPGATDRPARRQLRRRPAGQ